MVLVVLSLGTPPPEWGKYSHGVWKLLTPIVNSMYIKRARSYRPKSSVPCASTTATTGTASATGAPGVTGTTGTSGIPATATGTTSTTTGTTADINPGTTGTTGTTTGTTTTAEGRLVYLHRSRIVGHGSVFSGDVPKVMESLPRTDALLHVHMVGPYTKEEKVLAVDPIVCRGNDVRKLFGYMLTYNKPVASYVNPVLDEDVMTALQESLVDANAESVPGAGVALNEDDHDQPSTSGELINDSSPVTYIGTNLLITDHTSSDNADLDLDGEEEPVVADESATEPNEAGIQEDDGLAAFFEQYDHCEGDEGHEGEGQQATDARTAREQAEFEAIAYRVHRTGTLYRLISSKP